MTNLVGEHVFLSEEHFAALMRDDLKDRDVLARLREKHLVQLEGETLPADLLSMKLRTRKRRLSEATGLHIFVVTLRCEHTCRYCQVSRQASSKSEFDMTEEIAEKALAMAFESPSAFMKIEFQGGEPLLNMGLVRWIVARANELNRSNGKNLSFVIASNLSLLDDSVLDFCEREGVVLSTSLDGPRELHNDNRRRPGQDSWDRTVTSIRRAQERLGTDRVSALMTTTEMALDKAESIVDTYVSLGLTHIFLRPVSPYGFALRGRGGGAYAVERWLSFYESGLRHILHLNSLGTPVVEVYAAIIAKKMFTNDDPGYVDLTSPAGIGLGALVYNYEGGVYASDEGRMLAEMKDETFRLGDVQTHTYQQIMSSEALLDPLYDSYTGSVPMCSTCVHEPYCGSDPVFHHATMGNFVGHKAHSGFCRRNMGVFELILRIIRDEPEFASILRSWASA